MARSNESELIVPLRNAWNITRYKRAPRAMQIIREQVIRHLKVREDEELYIDPEVNEFIWKRGIENPPRKIRLMVIRHDEPDFPVEVKLMKDRKKWAIFDQVLSKSEPFVSVKSMARNSTMISTTTSTWLSN